ncbi:unnamed protein product, partial [Pocillopora meandrina]
MLTATQMTDENVSKNFQDPLSRSRAEISLETTFAILICLAFILVYVLVLYIVNRYSEFILLNPCINSIQMPLFILSTGREGQYFSSYLLQGLLVFTGGVLCSGALSNNRQAFFISKQEN